jgi:hypothetical protein
MKKHSLSARRQFLKTSTAAVAGAASLSLVPAVHAAGNDLAWD